MRWSIEKMTYNEPRQELPSEVFQDVIVLKRTFFQRISRPGWILQWQKISDRQRQNDFKETQIEHTTHHDLAGSHYLNTLSPITGIAEKSGNILDTDAVYYFSFICFPYADLSSTDASTFLDYALSQEFGSTVAGQQLLELQQRLSYNVHWSLQLPRVSTEEIEAWGPGVVPFIQSLGLEPYWRSHPSLEHWKKALVPICDFLERLEAFCYATFVMDTVSRDITNLIPSWKKLNERTKKHLIVHIHNYSSIVQDKLIPGDFHHLIINIQDHLPEPAEFSSDYLTFSHEYAHAIVQEFFFSTTKQLDHIQNPQLIGMIHEAIAITVEQAFIQLYALDPHEKSFLNWASDRTSDTKTVLQGRRDRDLNDYPFEPKITHYTEGVRLARKLQAKGWRVEDIPVLLERIRNIFFKVMQTKDVYAMYSVGLTFDPASAYQKIIRTLLEEQPPKQ